MINAYKLFFCSYFLAFAITQFSVTNINAQGVGINPSGNPADPSAILDASSTTKGQLMPRMTSAQRDLISSPAIGLVIYNLDCNNFNYYNGTGWVSLNNITASVNIAASPAGGICAGTSVTFTATPANGGTSPVFQWNVNGGNVGTNSSTYTSSGLNNGDLVTCVLTSNAPCVTGSPATSNSITVIVSPVPQTPGAISGTTTVCANSTGNVYAINPVANATSYNWTLPSGAFITSGAGTTSITVTFGANSGNITVSGANSCGIGSQNSLAITFAATTSTGTVTQAGNYTVHTFTTSGTFTPASCLTNVEVLVVAGGGSGGGAGGGGGGGVVYHPSYSLTNQTYTVTVGAGGLGAQSNTAGNSGSNSVFGTITAIGGGAGGDWTGTTNGGNGGSGGGGGWNNTGPIPGGSSTQTNSGGGTGYGNSGGNGGNNSITQYTAGGGGGAGAAGGSATTTNSGNGGDGISSSISGTLYYYGGGGGGGAQHPGLICGNGGRGGGGGGGSFYSSIDGLGGTGGATNGEPGSYGHGGAGGANTGGGSGGMGISVFTTGNGGSGIVIVRYQNCIPPAAPTAGNNNPMCEGSTLNLSASSLPGAVYNWTGPNGFTSTDQNPTIANTTVAYSGTYSVTALINGCISNPGGTSVTINTTPSTPGAISGPFSGIANQTGVTYSISAVAGATSYTWTVPSSGATIASGQGGISITVDFSASCTGNITVTAGNTCGSSAPASINVSTISINATGGTITHVGGYTIHSFTTDGTFTPGSGGNVEVLVVAGGGSGGGAGGGGGGGVVYHSSYSVTNQAYTVTVGAGGLGAQSNTPGNIGGNSVFSTITAIGGGAGGDWTGTTSGGNGGSGGGGGWNNSGPVPGGSSTQTNSGGGTGYGNSGGSGGNNSITQYTAGGGGGAGAVGGSATATNSGNGGDGISSSISGTLYYYGGGGGGGAQHSGLIGGNGGLGGGGGGGSFSGSSNGLAGTGGTANGEPGSFAYGGAGGANTGGGSGGMGISVSTTGNGGSGIVIVRYPD